jgi:hypothetical protein
MPQYVPSLRAEGHIPAQAVYLYMLVHTSGDDEGYLDELESGLTVA